MQKVISECPVCKSRLKAVKLKCDVCDTTIENDFALTKFDYLPAEDLYFVEVFLKSRGNIKEVEKELGISYPTVRAKLDGVLAKLGYQNLEKCDVMQEKKQRILSDLEQGRITPEEAVRQLEAL